MKHNPERRAVLRKVLIAGGALCVPKLWAGVTIIDTAEAGKMNKTQAKYQNQPRGDQNCAMCINFILSSECKVVEGPISATGWCMLWAKKSA